MSPADATRRLTTLMSQPRAVPLSGLLPLLPITAAPPMVKPRSIISSTQLSLRTAPDLDGALLTLVLAACGMRNASTAERFDPQIAARITTTARRLAPLAGELLDTPLLEPTVRGIITLAQLPLTDTPRWAQLARLGIFPPPLR